MEKWKNKQRFAKHDEPAKAKPRGKAPIESKAAPSGSGVIFGLLPVIEALKAQKRRVDRVLIADGARESRISEVIDLCRERSISWTKVPRETLARLVSPGGNHQGVVAFTAAADYISTDELFEQVSDSPLILILDGVEDPRNLGAILRVVECAGADGVVIPERRAVGLNETVAKSSAGAIEYVRVAKAGNLNRFIEEAKEQRLWVVGTSLEGTMDYTEWDWAQPTAIVLGGEGGGLHRLVAENCDVLVKIPMYGKIDSLNVSVAAGVLLFEAKRQRSLIKDGE
jgi:23S rRNA (guanosine2251-2'-O)-methyltransferase